MRKGLIVLLAAVVAVAFALPAMADLIPTNLKVSGFYRSKAYMSNFHSGQTTAVTTSEQEKTFAFVEQRARVKFAFGNENVQAVWQFESDMLWGDSSGAPGGRNTGGALGADSVQLETKNVYVWFKVPDTSIDVTVGLQAFPDAYAGVLFSGGGTDAAGIAVKGKFEPVTYRVAWAKLYGDLGSQTDEANDTDLYILEANFAPMKEAKVGANLYFLKDGSGKLPATAKLDPFNGLGPIVNAKLNLYIPGVTATFKAGPATLTGFGFYQFGELESTIGAPDIDVRAYGADVRATMKLGPGNFFVEGLYLSGGDDPADEYEAPITLGDFQSAGVATGPGGVSGFSRTRMQILLPSWDTINVSQCLIGCSGGIFGDSPGNGGRGIWHIAAGYSQNVTPKVKIEANVGYMAATDLYAVGDEFRDNDFGTEVNAGLHYNIAKGLDVGVFGAYVFLGDFVNVNATSSFEDPWTTYARVNYAF
jgi:hypothetical protein